MKEKFTKLFGALMLVALMLGLVMPFQTAAAQAEIPSTETFTVAASDGDGALPLEVDVVITNTTAVPTATYYNIYRSFTESGTKTMLANNFGCVGVPCAVAVTPLTYIDTTAIPGTTYWYWVEACDNTSCTAMVGNDGWRAVSGFAVGSTVTATLASFYDKIEVTVNTPTSPLPVVDGTYKIQRRQETPTVGTTWSTLGNTTTLLFKDTTAPGQKPVAGSVQPTYTYRVDICGKNHCASENTPAIAPLQSGLGAGSLNTLADPVLTATAGAGKVTLSWMAVTDAMVYYGQRSFGSLVVPASPLALQPAVKPDVPAILPYTKDDATVVAGNTYTYNLWACYTATNCSHPAPATSGSLPTVTVPADFKISKGDDTTAPAAGIDMTFTAASNPAYAYTEFRSDDSAGLVNVLETPLTGTTPGAPALFNDPNVNAGQSYYYWLKVCDTSVVPNVCKETSKLEGWGKIPAPTGFLLVSTTAGVAGSWNAVAVPNVFYQGFRNTTNSFTGALGPKNIPGNGTPVISGTDPNGTAGTTYWYYVRACVGTRCSATVFGSGMKLP